MIALCNVCARHYSLCLALSGADNELDFFNFPCPVHIAILSMLEGLRTAVLSTNIKLIRYPSGHF